MQIGLISDTHGYLDPSCVGHFEGVDLILHAGDIGPWSIVVGLEAIAPVTAVLGNNDAGLPARESELVTVGAERILIHHIVNPVHPTRGLVELMERRDPTIVIFGHTHQAFGGRVGSRLFINPGYAGRPRFGAERSIAILTLEDEAVSWRFIELAKEG